MSRALFSRDLGSALDGRNIYIYLQLFDFKHEVVSKPVVKPLAAFVNPPKLLHTNLWDRLLEIRVGEYLQLLKKVEVSGQVKMGKPPTFRVREVHRGLSQTSSTQARGTEGASPGTGWHDLWSSGLYHLVAVRT